MRSQRKIFSTMKLLPLAVFLGACSFVPSYQQPEVSVAEKWMDFSLKETEKGVPAPELGWKDYFKDPQLQALIATALEHNHDLRTSVLTMQKYAEEYHIDKLDQLPTISLSGDAARARTGESSYGDSYSAGLGFSSFELDFFGRVSALSESALNTYLKTKEARDSQQLAIIEATAQAYYGVRIDKRLMELSEDVLKSRQKTYQLGLSQFNIGVIDEVTLRGYENAIEVARASYYAYQRSYRQAINALSVLVGEPVNQLDLPAMGNLDDQFSAMQVPSNISSSILANRPDIREAEYALRAANADIGAAKAALYPTISLTGNLGYSSTELNNLLEAGSAVWSIAPSLTLPIFNRSELYSDVKISEIDQKILIESYQSAVASAFQEVGDALIAKETYDKEYQSSVKAAAAEHRVLNLEKMRFNVGTVDGMDLLTAERDDFTSRQTVLTTQLELLNNLVTLYVAMGGGLIETTDPNTVSNAAIQNNQNPGIVMPEIEVK